MSTVTVYYGQLVADQWSLEDEDFGTMLAAYAPGFTSSGRTFNQIFTRLHLVWDAGKTWHITTGANWDFSIHGYQFQP